MPAGMDVSGSWYMKPGSLSVPAKARPWRWGRTVSTSWRRCSPWPRPRVPDRSWRRRARAAPAAGQRSPKQASSQGPACVLRPLSSGPCRSRASSATESVMFCRTSLPSDSSPALITQRPELAPDYVRSLESWRMENGRSIGCDRSLGAELVESVQMQANLHVLTC